MNVLNRYVGCIAVLLALLCFEMPRVATAGNPLVCTSAPDSPMYVVSIPPEKIAPLLKDGRRITGFKVKVSSGLLCSYARIPMDWWVRIEPDMEAYQIHAEAGHGASWLTTNDISHGAFDKFIVVKAAPKEGKLKIRANLSIDIPSEEKERYEIITEKDMILVPYK